MSVIELDMAKFVDRRTKALATVFLTSQARIQERTDEDFVRVFEVDAALGVDLMARVGTTASVQVVMFGLVLKGTIEPLPTTESATIFLNQQESRTQRSQVFPFPVIALLYSMDGDRGYFAWVNEPILVEENIRMVVRQKIECHPASGRQSLEEIVSRVRWWFESIHQVTSA